MELDIGNAIGIAIGIAIGGVIYAFFQPTATFLIGVMILVLFLTEK